MILVHKVTPFSWDHSGNTCYQTRNQRLNSVSSVSGHYFAFFSNSIPKVFPSVSWQVANHPTVGIAIFGISGMILGPAILAVTVAFLEVWKERLAASRITALEQPA